MHATLAKFGYPQGCLLESPHWAVLLRPVQCTLGALVLCSKTQEHALPSLAPEAFTDLRTICQRLECALAGAFGYEKINYLMLMMVDPEVHFHVLPRYSSEQVFAGHRFPDSGWPGPPDISAGVAVEGALTHTLLAVLRKHLPAQGASAEPDGPTIPTR